MKIAIGVMRSAVLNPLRSESHPIIIGEIASPNAWMKNIFTAKDIARMAGLVTLTMVVLSGPVLRNRKNSAKKVAPKQKKADCVERAKMVIGTPARKPQPDTSR
jgi:hypothetical protein